MEDEKPKISKTEEKENFIKQLEAKTEELRATEERIKALVERNEELAARKLLGGKTDAGVPFVEEKEDTPAEYAIKFKKGQIPFT